MTVAQAELVNYSIISLYHMIRGSAFGAVARMEYEKADRPMGSSFPKSLVPTISGEAASPAACPRCAAPMHLDKVTLPSGGDPEVRTYLCQSCTDPIIVAVLDG